MFYADPPTSTCRHGKRVMGKIAAAILGLQMAFAITGAQEPRIRERTASAAQDCPADQAVIGVKINSGAHVNAIGLMCGHGPQFLPPPRQ